MVAAAAEAAVADTAGQVVIVEAVEVQKAEVTAAEEVYLTWAVDCTPAAEVAERTASGRAS